MIGKSLYKRVSKFVFKVLRCCEGNRYSKRPWEKEILTKFWGVHKRRE